MVHGFSNPFDRTAWVLVIITPDIDAQYFHDVAEVVSAPADRTPPGSLRSWAAMASRSRCQSRQMPVADQLRRIAGSLPLQGILGVRIGSTPDLDSAL